MKKKTVGIAAIVIFASVLLSVAIAAGALFFIRNRNLKETGNILGVRWYNEEDLEFTITTKEELYELAQLSDFYTFKDQTIYLGADIVLNEGNASEWAEHAPKLRWSPITGFAGTFDGQGHTISGLYARSYESSMALFSDTEYSCTVRNIKLVNSYFHTGGGRGVASFVSKGGGKFYQLYSDAIFDHSGQSCGGIASQINKQSIFEECWFDGTINAQQRNIGGLIDVVTSSRVEIRHSLFSGTINQNYQFEEAIRTAGICGRVERGAGIILDDTLSCGAITTNVNSDVGSMFGFSGPESTLGITNTYTSRDTWLRPTGSKGGTYTGSTIDLFGQNLVGEKAYQWTTLDFDRYWAIVEDGTPILQCFGDEVPSLEGVEKVYDTDWYTGASKSYVITTREQLYGLFYLSKQTNFEGIQIQLGADIVVNDGNAKNWKENRPDYLWYPIEDFNGTFDGQGHTISGICLLENRTLDVYTGLFGRAMQGSTIENFQLKNSYVECIKEIPNSVTYMGSIAGETRGTVDSVYSDAIIYTNGNQVGGIVGRMAYLDKTEKKEVLVNNCWFDGDITADKTYMIGGIAGIAYRSGSMKTKLTISHCLNTGTIHGNRVTTDDTFAAGQRMGGILGYDLSTIDMSIIDCLNVGEFDLIDVNHAGSVVGTVAHAASNFTITDTYATAESCPKEGRTIHAAKGTVTGGAAVLPSEWYIGKNAYRYSNLDFDHYWAIVEGGTPVLKTFAKSVPSLAGLKKLADTSWYSEEKDELVIDSVEDLYGFYVLSTYRTFAGKTVKLGANITVNAGNAADWKMNAPANVWRPIGNSTTRFAGTFDGQGNTISGIYLKDESEQDTYSGLFGIADVGSVIKNFRLTNSYFERAREVSGSAAYMGSIVGELRGTVDSVYSDAIMYTDGHQVGGIVGRMAYTDAEGKQEVTVTNCWFDGEITANKTYMVGGIAGIAYRSATVQTKLVISHCLNTGTIIGNRVATNDTVEGGQRMGGILGYDLSTVDISILDCLNVGGFDLIDVNHAGSIVGTIGHTGSTFTIRNTYATTESCPAEGRSMHAIKGTVVGGVALVPEVMLTDTNAYQYSSLNFNDYWAVIENDTPELRKFSGAGKNVAGLARLIDTSWYDNSAKVLTIDSVEDLYGFWEVFSYDKFAGKTVQLGADIAVNPEATAGKASTWGENAPKLLWPGIGSYSTPFEGTFDGQGYTISGIYVKNEGGTGRGLFNGTAPGSLVKNLRLTNSYIVSENGARIGSVVGNLRGDLADVYSDAIVVANGSANMVGGLVGTAKYYNAAGGSITDCWFDGQVIGTGSSNKIGGIAGAVMKTGSGYEVNITDCLMSGVITYTGTNSNQYIGGIFGDNNNVSMTVNIIRCLVTGKIHIQGTHRYAASLVGAFRNAGGTCTITDSYATAESYLDGNKNLMVDQLASGNGTIKGNSSNNFISRDVLSDESAAGLFASAAWTIAKDESPVLLKFTDLLVPAEITADTGWYDGSGVYTVTTADELYGLQKLSETSDLAGDIFYLGADITINAEMVEGKAETWGEEAPEHRWNGIGSYALPFAGIFDGQGYTVSGIYMKGDTQTGLGFFNAVAAGSEVKNLRLTDSYIEATNGARIGSVVGNLRGTMTAVYSDATIVANGSANMVGGLVGVSKYYNAAGGNMTGCWFAGQVIGNGSSNKIGGILGSFMKTGSGYEISITDCLMTGTITYTGTNGNQYIGGIFGDNNNVAMAVNLVRCLVMGEINIETTHKYVGSFGGAFRNASGTCTITDSYATIESYQDGSTNVTVDQLASGNGAIKGNSSNNFVDRISLTRDTASGLFSSNAWTTAADGSPVLAAFADLFKPMETDYDLSWYDGSGDYTISTADQLYGFAYLAKTNDFAGETIRLGADITINDESVAGRADTWGVNAPEMKWQGIGSYDKPFAGVFDGQGKTIYGIYMKADTQTGLGFFNATASGSKVQNFYLKNSYIEATNGARIGSVIGNMRGTMTAVYSNAIVVANGSANMVGGLAGVSKYYNAEGGNMTNCWYDGQVIGNGSSNKIGGLIGAFMKTGSGYEISITDCLMTGTITYTGTNGNQYIGGIFGDNNNVAMKVNITRCLVAGKIDIQTTHKYVGSFGGVYRNASGTCTITDSYATVDSYQDGSTNIVVDQLASGNGVIAGNSSDNFVAALSRETVPALFAGTAWTTAADGTPTLAALSKAK